jgi:S-DNA-T family DNA segregation ATPase FtsK/SpoIIIE
MARTKTTAKQTKQPSKTGKKPSSNKAKEAQDTAAIPSSGRMILNQIMPYILICLALFVSICFILTETSGILGNGLRDALFGMFSTGAVAVPFIIINYAVYWRRDSEKKTFRYRLIFSAVCLIFISVLIHVFTSGGEELEFAAFWDDGLIGSGGGIIGGFLGALMLKGIGVAGTLIISVSMLIIFVLFLFGFTPYSIAVYIAFHIHELKERRDAKKLENEADDINAVKDVKTPALKKGGDVVPVSNKTSDNIPVTAVNAEAVKSAADDSPPFDISGSFADASGSFSDITENETIDIKGDQIEIIKPIRKPRRQNTASTADETPAVANTSEPASDSVLDTSIIEKLIREQNEKSAPKPEAAVKDSDAQIEIERHKLISTMEQTESGEPPFIFPPVTLLNIDTTPKNNDISEELDTTAKKLVATLNSFKVSTKIVNVSRGPTITRYELSPDEGVRVRSISNLVDDIALNLATSGVRIEAPIPGKSAVGIEVPNRIVATVYLRELIESQRFKAAQSKITVSLGVDVAGEPIYVDLSKMPHLLIAGATGMGKSVCINSMIMSLLFKSSPKEVNLILIDPKKVELNIYNGLPHLLVPVVSDPKKAAGALAWAVTEMERRYELIEAVGVRDIKSYNAAVQNDPDRENMAQIVIIIDELADLMMTAPDDVEESICRLAQKARAAGMHLVIGTQRPSVDVITGLIKANIPSRIAFAVASQIDSRTIDIPGAEKLIGRGDMLYSPVGMSKPIRVQGAFVSESEIELVTNFIKNQDHNANAAYDSKVLESIEKAAEECGQTGRHGVKTAVEEDNGETDPMLKSAIELAVESGKISTSLIQRRLSLGYGRAAKLIDHMEQLGFVSAPEGQKPRNVLITRQQYMEMVLNNEAMFG